MCIRDSLEAAPDFEVAGVVRRNPNDVPDELKAYTVTDSITKLDKVDVAVLATPTRSVETYAKEILSLGINTVDSFDIHGGIVDLRRSLDAVAKAHNTVAVISAGWDPGSDSVVRALLEAMVPKGITYTNFGPGMSMGHTEMWIRDSVYRRYRSSHGSNPWCPPTASTGQKSLTSLTSLRCV